MDDEDGKMLKVLEEKIINILILRILFPDLTYENPVFRITVYTLF